MVHTGQEFTISSRSAATLVPEGRTSAPGKAAQPGGWQASALVGDMRTTTLAGGAVMDEQPVKTRKQLEAQLIDKAIKDASFRQELVRDIAS